MGTIYRVRARADTGRVDEYFVRAVSARAARFQVFAEAQRAWGDDFYYQALRVTIALGPRDDVALVDQFYPTRARGRR